MGDRRERGERGRVVLGAARSHQLAPHSPRSSVRDTLTTKTGSFRQVFPHVGYPGYDGEVWAAPGRDPISDPYGHPLTWGSVRAAHADLVRHASCSLESMAASGYGSDSEGEHEVCACQYHDVLIDQLSDARRIVAAWPGPLCGVCYASTCCGCGYVFEDASAAAGVGADGRLVCHGRACSRLLRSADAYVGA